MRKTPFQEASECVQALQMHYASADLTAVDASGAEHGIHRRVFEFVPREAVVKVPCLIRTIPQTKKNHFYVGNPDFISIASF